MRQLDNNNLEAIQALGIFPTLQDKRVTQIKAKPICIALRPILKKCEP